MMNGRSQKLDPPHWPPKFFLAHFLVGSLEVESLGAFGMKGGAFLGKMKGGCSYVVGSI